MKALKLTNVSKLFDNFTAVDDVSFSVDKGCFLTLLGPSGCGKTTLLKLIGGFHKPSSGKIFINGEDVSSIPPEIRDTTMCFQSYALFPHLSVADNITFGLKQKKLQKTDRISRLREVVDQVDLASQIEKFPSMLSGGQQQRVALARALAMRSGLILFDEPLSNLDAKLREQVRFEIRQLQRDHGFTAIYVTHDQSEALAMSDQIIVLNRGRIEQMGSPEEIYRYPANSFIADFIGTANILEGQVTGKEKENLYHVSTAMGDLMVSSDRQPEADRILISWRPEDAEMNYRKNVVNVFDSIVETSVYQGNLTDLLVRSKRDGSPQYRIQTFHDTGRRKGDSLRFHIAPERIRFLEAVE